MTNHFFGPALLPILAAVVSGCGSDQLPPAASEPERRHDPAAIIGRQWQWVRTVTPVETIEVADPTRYTLRLDADGRAVLQLDCNRGSGSYEISEGRLSFGPLMSTRMACPPDSQDAVYNAELSRINSFFVQDDALYLEMPFDSGTMRFERDPE